MLGSPLGSALDAGCARKPAGLLGPRPVGRPPASARPYHTPPPPRLLAAHASRLQARVRRTAARAVPPDVPGALDSVEPASASGRDALLSDQTSPRFFGIPQRWLLVAATSAAFVLCNMDKVGGFRANSGSCAPSRAAHPAPQVNMSVALIPMAATFGWTGAEKGLVRRAGWPCALRLARCSR